MKAIKKPDPAKIDNQFNLPEYKKIDRLLKKHSKLEEEENQKNERMILQNLKNLNDGL